MYETRVRMKFIELMDLPLSLHQSQIHDALPVRYIKKFDFFFYSIYIALTLKCKDFNDMHFCYC